MLQGSILTYDLRPLKLQQSCIVEVVIFGRRWFQTLARIQVEMAGFFRGFL
jgi:hypothetical protein